MLAELSPTPLHTVTVLRTATCPGGAETERLARSLAQRHGQVQVEVILVADGDQAAVLGFRGSPTVLVDGEDVEPDSGIPLGSMA